jgi:hypothetical protein
MFKSIGPSLRIPLAHKSPSYDIKLLLKVVFDKIAFGKFNVSNNFKQNVDETHSKQPKKSVGKFKLAYGFEKSLEKKSVNQKSRDFCQMFVIS